MTNIRYPFAAIIFAIISTIILWDLKYDLHSIEAAYRYYNVDQNAEIYFKLFIPLLIVVLAIDLIYNIFKFRKSLDIATALLNLISVFGFVFVNIPCQEKIVELGLNRLSEMEEYYEKNKLCHMILLPVMALSFILQMISVSNQDYNEENNEIMSKNKSGLNNSNYVKENNKNK